MKAEICMIIVYCPKCRESLYNFPQYMACINPNCEIYKKKFKNDIFKLEEYSEPKILTAEEIKHRVLKNCDKIVYNITEKK